VEVVVKVHRAYRFRLYPTAAQDAELREWERQLRWLYNLAHEQRLLALGRPRGEQPRIDYFRQGREMTEILRGGHDQLARVVCCARQETLRDLDKAWQRWRKRLGGRPRFKRRTDAVRIYLSTPKHWAVPNDGTLVLAGAASSVGAIEIRQDRPWPGDAKFSSCHLVRDVDQWFAVFPLEYTETRSKACGPPVGINRGAVHAVADTEGRVIDSPAYYAKAMGRIARLSRELGRKETGSRNWHKAAAKLARAHRKVRRQREWFLHDLSRMYVGGHKLKNEQGHRLIAIEDWSTKEMTSSEPDETFTTKRIKSAVNRSILDVGWYELRRQIKYKAEATGAEVREVPVFDRGGEEIGISSVCSVCGAALPKPASGRAIARCEGCDHTEVGDLNAARNVLVRAEQMAPPAPKTPKASIKIKGRVKRTETAVNPTVDASGGDPPARGPVERGTPIREDGHHAGTVSPDSTDGTHPPMGQPI
jgi:putative transposase